MLRKTAGRALEKRPHHRGKEIMTLLSGKLLFFKSHSVGKRVLRMMSKGQIMGPDTKNIYYEYVRSRFSS